MRKSIDSSPLQTNNKTNKQLVKPNNKIDSNTTITSNNNDIARLPHRKVIQEAVAMGIHSRSNEIENDDYEQSKVIKNNKINTDGDKQLVKDLDKWYDYINPSDR